MLEETHTMRNHTKQAIITITAIMLGLALALIAPYPSQLATVQAQTESPVDFACATTPNTVGQGFLFSGQGFLFSGQSFLFSGQGFLFSGQDFLFSGQGQPVDLLAELEALADEANRITPQWFRDLLPSLVGGVDENAARAHILVVDEPRHGGDVIAALETLLQDEQIAPFVQNISYSLLDVSAPAINYQAGNMAVAIQDEVNRLRASGVDHVVLNMSFAFLDCQETLSNGATFSFQSFLEERERQEADPTPERVTPVLECVEQIGVDTYLAHFGYLNENDEAISIPAGSDNNKLSPANQNGVLPAVFEPGRHRSVIRVPFTSGNLVWTLRNPDVPAGDPSGGTATASANSQRCNQPAPEFSVVPILECVIAEGDGYYSAVFGYHNPNNAQVNIAVGANNAVNNAEAEQPQYFLPGRSERVFRVPFYAEETLMWRIITPGRENDVPPPAVADASSTPCVEPQGYGLGDYFVQELGLSEAQTIQELDRLFETVEETTTDLIALQALLAGYLREALENGNTQTVYAVASSGNYRPWLTDEPLVPAKWDETIASSAYLGAAARLWQFSHDGNIATPGASYWVTTPDGQQKILSGTSFAAPGLSLALAKFGTYPAACLTQGTPENPLPPLVSFLFNNAPLPQGLTCRIDTVVEPQLAVTDLVLINAETNTPIGALPQDTEGFIEIDLAEIGTESISIEAFTNGAVGSVIFNTNGTLKTENQTPYTLNGDSNGGRNYTPWPYEIGLDYVVTVTPYTERRGAGQAGQAATIRFRIVDNREEEVAEPTPLPEITQLWLIDAAADQPIAPIPLNTEGFVEYDLATLGTEALSIQAQVEGEAGSVFFDLTNQTENDAPYAITGDGSGGTDFLPWGYQLETAYTITVTPFAPDGRAGQAVIIRLRLVDSRTQAPILTPISDQTSLSGEIITNFAVPATDNAPGLMFFAGEPSTLPMGLQIDPHTGIISGTLQTVAADTAFNVEIRVRDSDGNIAALAFVWTVLAPQPEPETATPTPTEVEVCWHQDMNGAQTIWYVTNNNLVPLEPGTQERVYFDYTAYDGLNATGTIVGEAQTQQANVGSELQINTGLAKSLKVTYYIWDNGATRRHRTVGANVTADACDPANRLPQDASFSLEAGDEAAPPVQEPSSSIPPVEPENAAESTATTETGGS